jgi:molybdopterin synthase catalytic subunit
MQVTVRLFAALRERAGRDHVVLDLPEGARVADALQALDPLAPGLPLVLAVNREYAERDRALEAGDELAVVPPVSGAPPPRGSTPPSWTARSPSTRSWRACRTPARARS